MAYLAFAETTGGLSPVAASIEDRTVTRHLDRARAFSALEWSVIAIAERDRLSTLREPGPLSIAMGAVFGGKRHNPKFADAQLEALRRMAVLSWHYGYVVPGEAVKEFVAAGYTLDQYEMLVDSISATRRSAQTRNRNRKLN